MALLYALNYLVVSSRSLVKFLDNGSGNSGGNGGGGDDVGDSDDNLY